MLCRYCLDEYYVDVVVWMNVALILFVCYDDIVCLDECYVDVVLFG